MIPYQSYWNWGSLTTKLFNLKNGRWAGSSLTSKLASIENNTSQHAQWHNFVPGCPWVPEAQSGVDAPGRVILGTTQLKAVMHRLGCPLSKGARRFAHPEPIGVTPLSMHTSVSTLPFYSGTYSPWTDNMVCVSILLTWHTKQCHIHSWIGKKFTSGFRTWVPGLGLRASTSLVRRQDLLGLPYPMNWHVG